MGEIADSIINGDFDYITGEYLGPGDGFPRTSEDSQGWDFKTTKSKSLNGLLKFLKNHADSQEIAEDMIRTYASEMFGEGDMSGPTAKRIQEDFNKFRKWVHNNVDGFNTRGTR